MSQKKRHTVTIDTSNITLPGTVGLNPSPSSDHTGSGFLIVDTVGEGVSIGDVLYRKSDFKWWKANAGAVATMPGAGLAMEAKSAGASCKILLYGMFRDDSWSYTPWSILYVSTTPGPPTETAPSSAGDQVQAVAMAMTATVILWNPSYELVEHG